MKLKCDKLLSSFAFKFKLRRYSMACFDCMCKTRFVDLLPVALGRGLHSSTFRLNVSTFSWIRWVHDFPPVYYTGGHMEV